MSQFLFWVVVLSGVTALVAGAAVLARAYIAGTTPGAILFKQRPDPRIGVIEHANIDGRRKLLLIRRDNVEHLLMTGGPVDVVIETGIGDNRGTLLYAAPAQQPASISRSPRGSTSSTPRSEPEAGALG